jgi:hypothetical protein
MTGDFLDDYKFVRFRPDFTPPSSGGFGPISSHKVRAGWHVAGMWVEGFGGVNECMSCELMSGMVIGIILTADERR